MDNKKVILIKGTNSNWYEQVIFILKPNKINNIPVDLVQEAEKIINSYMKKKYPSKIKANPYHKVQNQKALNPKISKKTKIKNKNSFFNSILNFSLFFCILLVGFLLYKIGF